MSPNYTLINKLFQLIVLNNRWDAYIALNYFDYLLFEGWDYDALIVRTLLLENNICLTGEFCLDTELVKMDIPILEMMRFGRGEIISMIIFH